VRRWDNCVVQGNYNVDKQTVEFLDIGKPEIITAPAHYTNQVTHG
jgi:hypothetical protein